MIEIAIGVFLGIFILPFIFLIGTEILAATLKYAFFVLLFIVALPFMLVKCLFDLLNWLFTGKEFVCYGKQKENKLFLEEAKIYKSEKHTIMEQRIDISIQLLKKQLRVLISEFYSRTIIAHKPKTKKKLVLFVICFLVALLLGLNGLTILSIVLFFIGGLFFASYLENKNKKIMTEEQKNIAIQQIHHNFEAAVERVEKGNIVICDKCFEEIERLDILSTSPIKCPDCSNVIKY